jgi:hypothetical protein
MVVVGLIGPHGRERAGSVREAANLGRDDERIEGDQASADRAGGGSFS